tara:strand:- start:36 stop:245 length:210 start_codon:yes stop_codon:yes gene_type:complete
VVEEVDMDLIQMKEDVVEPVVAEEEQEMIYQVQELLLYLELLTLVVEVVEVAMIYQIVLEKEQLVVAEL